MAKGITETSRLFFTISINPVEIKFPQPQLTGIVSAIKLSIPDTWQLENLASDALRIYPPDIPAFLTIRETDHNDMNAALKLTSCLDVFSLSDTWQGRIKGLLHTCVIGQGKTSAAIPVTFILDQFSPDGKRSFSLLFMGKRKAVIQYLMEFMFIRNSIVLL